MPAGLVRGFVAFYPGCNFYDRRAGWAPSAPLLIVMGEADDWTPAEPCRRLAAKFPERIKLVLYPGAYHDFDAPGRAGADADGAGVHGEREWGGACWDGRGGAGFGVAGRAGVGEGTGGRCGSVRDPPRAFHDRPCSPGAPGLYKGVLEGAPP